MMSTAPTTDRFPSVRKKSGLLEVDDYVAHQGVYRRVLARHLTPEGKIAVTLDDVGGTEVLKIVHWNSMTTVSTLRRPVNFIGITERLYHAMAELININIRMQRARDVRDENTLAAAMAVHDLIWFV